MKSLDPGQIANIDGHAEEVCISVYLPLSERPATSRSRFAHAVDNVEAKLLDSGAALRPQQAAALIAPLRKLSTDLDFWDADHPAVAVFASAGYFASVPVPFSVPELAMLGSRFHLKPLLPALSRNRDFYLLAFSRRQARLFHVCGQTFEPVPHATLADGVETLPNAAESDADRLIGYARAVEAKTREALQGKQVPLILATVGEHYGLYRKLNRHPFLLQEFVFGNPDRKTLEQMAREAVPMVRRHFQKKAELAAQTLEAALQLGGLATCEIEEAIDASEQGRIETCIVASDSEVWGEIKSNGYRKVIESGELDELSRLDLLDYLAVRTLKSGGEVYLAPSKRVPGKSKKVAALFRH